MRLAVRTEVGRHDEPAAVEPHRHVHDVGAQSVGECGVGGDLALQQAVEPGDQRILVHPVRASGLVGGVPEQHLEGEAELAAMRAIAPVAAPPP